MNRRGRFFLNTAIMTAGALVLRTVNISYRAWLFTRIGERGMGEYQLMMTVFFLAVTACTSGFGFAITRTIAEGTGGRSQLRLCTGVSLALSVVAGGAIWLLAPMLGATLLGGSETVVPLRLLALGLPMMSLSSCLKGYFLAVRNTVLPAITELLELGATIGIVVLLFERVEPLVALCLGATLGELLACIVVLLYYLWLSHRRGLAASGTASVRLLTHLVAPVLLGSLARGGLSSIENLLVPQGLARFAGDQSTALAQYGAVTGMVLPMLFLPLCVLTGAAVLLIPELAEMNSRGHRKSIESAATKAIELTLWFSFVTAAVVIFFSRELGRRFFDSVQAGEFLRLMSPIIPILYLDSVVDGMLKGLDQQGYSFRYNIVDGVLRVAMAAVLLPWLGITGYFLLLYFSEIFNCALSLGRLVKVARVRIDLVWWLVAPLLAAVVTYLLLRLSSSLRIGL